LAIGIFHLLGQQDHDFASQEKNMTEETVNVADAKKHFSELLGQVAFGKKHILI